jgi:Fe-S-cluster-containing dehydrogenase component
MTNKWNLIIDVATCENCNNCFLGCKDEFVGNDYPGYSVAQPLHGHRWVNIRRKERGECPMVDVAYLPTMCNSCDDAPCIKKAKNGAIYKRKDGIVMIDPVKAKGQKHLVEACPYEHIWWNDELEVPQNWFFDAHLLDAGWKEPRCVQSCATACMRAIKVSDAEMARIQKEEGLEVHRPELNTKPRVYYKNMYRYTRCFIGGELAVEKDGITDCLEGATVTLRNGSKSLDKTVTDNYGIFKFDDLPENSGKYTVEIVSKAHGKKKLEVELTDSRYIGIITL